MDDQRRPPGVVYDGVRNAAEEHRAQPRQPARPDHDRGRILGRAGFHDRLPDRPKGLYRQGFGIEARLMRDAGALLRKPVALLGRNAVELNGIHRIDHPSWLTGPGDAVETSKALPHGDDERMATGEKRGRGLNRILRVVRAVVADQQRTTSAVSHPSPHSGVFAWPRRAILGSRARRGLHLDRHAPLASRGVAFLRTAQPSNGREAVASQHSPIDSYAAPSTVRPSSASRVRSLRRASWRVL